MFYNKSYSFIDALTSSEKDKAFTYRDYIEDICITETHANTITTAADYTTYCAEKTTALTLLAGAATRWVRSLYEAQQEGNYRSIKPEQPRGLFPVQNLLPSITDKTIPIAGYSINAVHGAGQHLIVINGYQQEITNTILNPLGITHYIFREQNRFGEQQKPLGHGDAAWQTMSDWQRSDYVIVNFGGDANAHDTIQKSLLAFDTLNSLHIACDLLLPATYIAEPKYPIFFNAEGLPTQFGHNKLTKEKQTIAEGYSNVGIRIYKTAALCAILKELHDNYFDPHTGYHIPENNENDCALDNVDALLAKRQRARILAIARPQEITPVKSLADIQSFETAMQTILRP